MPSDSLQGSLELLVLKILARRAPLHGYAIMTAIEQISGEILRVEEGSLYPALHRMEESGWISAAWGATEAGRKARLYSLSRPKAANNWQPRNPAGPPSSPPSDVF